MERGFPLYPPSCRKTQVQMNSETNMENTDGLCKTCGAKALLMKTQDSWDIMPCRQGI